MQAALLDATAPDFVVPGLTDVPPKFGHQRAPYRSKSNQIRSEVLAKFGMESNQVGAI